MPRLALAAAQRGYEPRGSAVATSRAGAATATIRLRRLPKRRAAAAEPHFKALLRVEPQSVPGLLGLARTQATLQQINEARATLRRALRLAPGNPALLALQAQLSGR